MAQTYKYNMTASTHASQETKEQVLDSISANCGYFTVSDTMVVNHKEGLNPLYFHISRKTLDLDCRCFYYFTEMNDVIVVNEPMAYVVTAFITPKIVYITTFFITSP